MAAEQIVKNLSTQNSTLTKAATDNEDEANIKKNGRRSSNGDKGSRVPINLPVTSLDIKENETPQPAKVLAKSLSRTLSDAVTESEDTKLKKPTIAVTRKVTGRDRSTHYWAWLENMEPDALDGLTDGVKEKLYAAATARKLVESAEEEEETQPVPEPQYLKRVTSEILTTGKQISLEERAFSEPSIIEHEEIIMQKIKIWHPSGPGSGRVLKKILKDEVSEKFMSVYFEPKSKQKMTPRGGKNLKTKSFSSRNLGDLKPGPLSSNISIVNMSFQRPK